MIVLTLVVLGAAGYFSAALVREHGAPVRSVFVTAGIATAVVAFARIMILYGSMFLRGVHLSRPIGLLVFLLAMANSVIEMRLVSALTGPSAFSLNPSFPIAGLMVLTSVPLGFVWAWIRTRSRSTSG
jgi:hypothetical protein